METLFGDHAFGFGIFRWLAEWIPADDAFAQAFLIASLLVVRRTGYDQALDQISAAIRPAAAAWSRYEALLGAFERELPAYFAELKPYLAPSVSPDSFKGGDLTPLLQARFNQISAIAERHRDALQAFRKRHPEWSDEIPP